MSNVVLTVGGRRYSGWSSVEVVRSVSAIASSWSLTVTERYPGQPERWPIHPGDEFSLALDGELVATGHVDTRDISFSSTEHSVRVSGRSVAGDIVDCAPELGTYELLGQTALEIAQALARPFGVTVSSAVSDLPVFDRFAIQPGETAFEALDRACRRAGVLPIGQPDGSVVLAREGAARASVSLVEGQNVLSASLRRSHAQRFHRYVVGGQHHGLENFGLDDITAIIAEARDEAIRPARVTYIRPEGDVTIETAQQRADWEAAVRAGQSVDLRVTVQGWRQAPGAALWPINARASVRLPSLGIDGDMLITELRHRLDNTSGTITEIRLAAPGAYMPRPVIEDDDLWRLDL